MDQNKEEKLIEGYLISRDDIKSGVKKLYKKGYAKGKPIGASIFDPHYTYRQGELIFLLARENQGKTTFSFWLMMVLCKRFDFKVLGYCPENYPVKEIYMELAEMYLGQTLDVDSPDRATEEEFDKAIDWCLDHFLFVDFKNDLPTIKDLLSEFETQISKDDKIKFCFIDPLNSLRDLVPGQTYSSLVESLQLINRFKYSTGMSLLIPLHPSTGGAKNSKKNKGNDNNDDDEILRVLTQYDTSGGNMPANKADIFMVLHRDPYHPINRFYTDIYIKKVKKQKLTGIPTPEDRPIRLEYIPSRSRFGFRLKGALFDPFGEPKPKNKAPEIDFNAKGRDIHGSRVSITNFLDENPSEMQPLPPLDPISPEKAFNNHGDETDLPF